MAIPLVLLGAAFSALAVKELADERTDIQLARRYSQKVKTLAHLAKYDSPIAIYPSDFLMGIAKEDIVKVQPEFGAVVCCGLGGVLDHTGIYIGDDTIVELAGSGLVKAVSMKRFLAERSGENMFIACDSLGKPLINKGAAQKAIENIYRYYEYDVISNNCHRFIWQCFEQEGNDFSTFKTLSHKLANYYNRVLYWDVCKVL